MADESNFIFKYLGDTADVVSKVNELSRINAVTAEKMGTDFTNAVRVIDQQVEKISKKNIEVPVRDNQGKPTGEFRNQITDARTLATVIETADGKFKKLRETQVFVDNAWKSTTATVSRYKQVIQETTVKEQQYLGTVTKVKEQLLETQRINTRLAVSFGKAAQGAQILNTSVSGFKTNTIVKDGQVLTQTVRSFDTQIKFADGSLKTLRDTVSSTGGSVTGVASSFVQGSATAKTFGENLSFILKRAALTIPVWFALRQSLQTVFTTVRDGLKNLVAFDNALQQIRRNLSGSEAEITSQFGTLRSEITEFSLLTGRSTEEISEAVKAFATIGFSFEDSLKGGIEATKLAVVLFGSGAEVADAFARSIKILTDTSKGATSVQQQMAEAFALTAKLEKDNQFNINEVTESLIKFAPTAAAAGFSLKQTLTTLAFLGTAGRVGSNAGTLLSSSINQLRQNLDKLSGSLGVSVNPQLDTTFDVMVKVLGAARDLAKQDKLGAKQAEALAEVFGGEKGTKTIASLITQFERFKDLGDIVVDVTAFQKEFLRVNDTLANNVGKLNNQLKENAKSFTAALVGAEDFNSAVKNINSTARNTKPALENIGTLLNSIFSQPLNLLTLALLPAILKNLFTKAIPVAIGAGIVGVRTAITGFLAKIGAGFLGGVPGLIAVIGGILADAIPKGIIRGIQRADQQAQNEFRNVLQGLQGTLSQFDLNELIVNLKSGAIKLAPGVNKNVVIKQLEAELGKQIVIEADVAFKAASLDFLSTGESQNLNKLLIKNQLDISRAQGASTAELLKQETLLNKQFRIFEDEFSVLDRQLTTQRAITEEQRLQTKLGSDSVKLFDIAQKNGVDAARAIGNVLSGESDFSNFVRTGGENLEIFKREFSELFKQQQALAFFRGDTVPGANGLRGGFGIPIQEQFIRNQGIAPFSTNAAISRAQAVNQIPTIRNDIQAQIQFSVDVRGLSFREAVEAMKAEMAREVLNPQSTFTKNLDNHITGSTNTRL